jgi:hypothetical protein
MRIEHILFKTIFTYWSHLLTDSTIPNLTSEGGSHSAYPREFNQLETLIKRYLYVSDTQTLKVETHFRVME